MECQHQTRSSHQVRQTYPMIGIYIRIPRIEITFNNVTQFATLNRSSEQSLIVNIIAQISKETLTARSLVTRPRLTSLYDPFSLPASKRETSIRVDTSRVSRRLLLYQLMALDHTEGRTHTFLRAITSVSYLGDPSFVSMSRSSSGPDTNVRGVLELSA
jgi:hypothetical protein